jgi:hypothetical protein
MSAQNHLKLLISLAQIDGRVADREKNFIVNIGRANGIPTEEVLKLLTQVHEVIVPKDLTPDQKFQYILNLVLLMKIDERMYKDEIVFCSKIATRLGYDQQVMFELIMHVKATTMTVSEVESLKKVTEKYLKIT